jgi:uncharacterized membrane protein
MKLDAMTMTTADRSPASEYLSSSLDRLTQGLLRHWLLFASVALGIWTGLPWLAPVFMDIGWSKPARVVYLVYSFFCHQLPERSWFLFGPRFTLSLAEIQAASGTSTDFLALRRFIGTPALGWKLAWSDRMVSFYGGLFLFTLLYALVHRRIGGLRWRAAALLLLPMALDGITHMISDLWGVTAGFRQSNAWLAVLTDNLLPQTFYAGDAWGSFNSLARLVTGLLAAFGAVFWLFPWLAKALRGEES